MEQIGQQGKNNREDDKPFLLIRRYLSSHSIYRFIYVLILPYLRLDFLATYAAEHIDGGLISRELQTMLGCHVGLTKDLEGKETKANSGNQGGRSIYNCNIQ